jgi:hypothetical protein
MPPPKTPVRQQKARLNTKEDLGNFIPLRREWQKSAQNEKSSLCASFVSELELLQKLFDRHLMMRGDI